MNRYWTLAKRPPPPWPDASTFALRDGPIPQPGPGQALTRTIYVSLDPYQWGYKRRGVEPEGAPCHARTVAQVVESRIEGLAPGDFVFCTNGWAEYEIPFLLEKGQEPDLVKLNLTVEGTGTVWIKDIELRGRASTRESHTK